MKLNKTAIEIGPKTRAIIESTVADCDDIRDTKGIPRDEQQPLSKRKMRCACYVAIGIPAKSVSVMTGASYGTVRQWKTQARFKEVVAIIKEYMKKANVQRRVNVGRASSERRQSTIYGR